MDPAYLELLLNQPAIIIALVLMAVAVCVLGFVLFKTFEQPTKTVKLLNDILAEREKQHKAELAEERNEHLQERQKLEERIEALEADVAATNVRLEKKIAELGDANKVIAGMSEQISRLQTGLDAETKARQEVEARVSAAEAEAALKGEELQKAQAEIADLRECNSSVSAKVQVLQKQNAELKEQLAAVEADRAQTAEERDAANKRVSELEDEVKRLKTRVEELREHERRAEDSSTGEIASEPDDEDQAAKPAA